MVCPDCHAELPSGGLEACPHCGAVPSSGPWSVAHAQSAPDTTDPEPSGPLTLLSGVWPAAGSPAFQAPDPVLDEKGPLAVGQSFGTRYKITRLLGAGGMGAVYQAWDAELGIDVAIKVIRPSIMANPSAAAEVERRFKRELLLARQVTHRNVVRIHDLGDIGGIKYITMSYVEGTDLASELRRDGKLPIAAAMRVARSVVAGLAAAHAAGVVHRDLKPANIIVGANGEAQIMDFGIAYSPGDATQIAPVAPITLQRGSHGYAATMLGTIVGTVEYMAPEQAQGLPVDQRADIYSFGLILYEMLTGPREVHEQPQSALQALLARIEQPPPAPSSLNRLVPEALDRIVQQCLLPDPQKRFATTADLAAALARLDDRGELIPEARRITPRLVAAAVVVVGMLLGGTYLITRRAAQPPVQHEPVSVVVADLENRTSDPTLTRTLEPILRRALEGAGFVTAYDRSILSRAGAVPPEVLDAVSAREIAVREGLGIVLAGFIEPARRGYRISLTATHTVTGATITTVDGTAGSQDELLDVATRLVATVRTALGDETSESAQIFAMASLSATSLDVVRYYAAAQEAASNNRFEEARGHLLKAVAIDPTFGVGYQLLAVAARNLGQLQDAEKYINESLRYLDGMTERERFSTRGFYYRVTGDYQQCVKEYGEMIARFAADVTGRNQLALCQTQLRNMREAVEEMQQVVNILPKRALFRDNLALYASYAGEFARGEKEARAVGESDVYATLALAFAQLGQQQFGQAAGTYRRLAGMGPRGASIAASGLGDLAIVEGRFADAVTILRDGAAKDFAQHSPERAAAKLISLARAELLQGRRLSAVASAEEALMHSGTVGLRFLAGRVFVEAHEIERVRPLIAGLSSELQAEPRAYAKILEGEIALSNGDGRAAITLLGEANALLDTWIGHFVLGRAYLETGALIQADSEFERCIKRSGEALALFLDEEPTFGNFPPVYYYQGRIREALKTAEFADAYRVYLGIRGDSTEDPLAAEARKRVNP